MKKSKSYKLMLKRISSEIKNFDIKGKVADIPNNVKTLGRKIKNIKKKDVERFIKGVDKKLYLEIGNANIKLIEASKDEVIEVHKGFFIPTPEGAIEKDRIRDIRALVLAIDKKIKEERIYTRDLVISISSKEIITREMQVPQMKKENLENVVRIQANDTFPVKLDGYFLGYTIIGEGKEHTYNIMIAAIPKDIIIPYINLAEQLKLSLKSFSYAGYNLFNYVDFETEDRKSNYAIIDIGAESTNFAIVSKGVLKFNRTIDKGSNEINRLIDEKLNCGIQRAERLKRQYNSVIVLGKLASDEEVYVVAKIIQQVLDEIINELFRFIEFYNTKNTRNTVEKIYVTGLASRVSGLEEYIENLLGVPAIRLRDLNKVLFHPKAKRLKNKQISLVNCFGTQKLTDKRFYFINGGVKLSNALLVLNPKFYKIGACALLIVLFFASCVNFRTYYIKGQIEHYENLVKSNRNIYELQNEIKQINNKTQQKNNIIKSIPLGAEDIANELKIIEDVIDSMAEDTKITVKRYDFKEKKTITLKCRATKGKNPDSQYVLYNAPYDFADNLKQYFDISEGTYKPEDFSITLTIR